jgi:replicative DNA helicase
MSEELNFSGNPSLPPQNMEAEEAILGGILLDPDAITRIIDKLKPEAFYAGNNRVVYEAAVALYGQGKPTDLLSMTGWLTDHGKLQSIGVRQKLAELTDRVISAVNIDALADMVMEKYDRRQLIKTGNELVQLGHQTELPIDEVKNLSEQKVYAVTQSNRKSTLSKIGDIAQSNYQETCDIALGLKPAGIPYGYYDLDAMTHGLQRGNLIYIAGRPASGKTSYAMNIASHVGGKLKLPVAIFGFEMSKEENTKRFLSVESHVELSKILSGRLNDEEWIRYRDAVARLQTQYNVFIDDNTGNTVSSIHSACRSLTAQTGELGLVVVDYIQLMDEPGFKSGERQLELSQISRKFKKMAGQLNCPVMVLSQLSRGVEARTDKRPMMSDLRDSGSLEQDANLVQMLYRDEYYNPETIDKGIAEIIIVKHRNGPTGTVKLLFDAEYTQFKNVEKQTW